MPIERRVALHFCIYEVHFLPVNEDNFDQDHEAMNTCNCGESASAVCRDSKDDRDDQEDAYDDDLQKDGHLFKLF